MINKKALAEWHIVLLIFMIVTLLIAIFVIIKLGGTESGNVQDELCRRSNELRSSATMKYIGEIRPKVFFQKARVCNTQYETIDATDYAKCGMTSGQVRTIEGMKECASHQIADLAWRCWYMSGEGAWEKVGSWKCFTGKVVMNPFEGDDSEDATRANIKNQLKDKLGCGRDPAQELLVENSEICRSLSAKIADNLVMNLGYSAYVDFYRERILDGDDKEKGLSFCVIEQEPPVNAEELVGELIEMEENSNGELVLVNGVSEVLNGNVSTVGDCDGLYAYVNEQVLEIVKYQNEIKKINNEINDLLSTNLENPDKDITVEVCVKYDETCEVYDPKEYDKCCADWKTENVNQLNNLFETSLKIGSKLPDIGPISKNDIKGILKYKNNLKDGAAYSKSFKDSKFEFSEDFEINPNSLFEIGFCDPTPEAGEGVIENVEKIFICKGMIVQLGPGGTIGVSREGSPYCNVFNVVNKIDVFKGMQKYCQTATKS